MGAFDGVGAIAGGMNDALQELIKQRFLEQIERNRVAEDMARRQQQGQQFSQRLGFDEKQLAENASQFKTNAGFKEREVAGEEQMRPVRIAHTQAQTANTEADTIETQRKPTAEREAREFTTGRDKTGHGYNMEEIAAQGQNALRVANVRHPDPASGASPATAYADERTTRIMQSVDELEKKVSPFTTGAGSLLTFFPGTEATDFESEVESLKANIAFGELVEMRNASKTGGALGNVSDRESQLLSSTLGALNTRQSPANYRAQLQKIRGSLQRWQEAKAQYANGPVQPAAPAAQEFDWVPGKGLVPKGGK